MYVVEDCYISKSLLEAARATWPAKNWGHWLKYGNGKLTSKSPHMLPRACQLILDQLAEFPITRRLYARQTNAPVLFPDLEYLHGAGLHQLEAGDTLGLHLDTERHPVLNWKREATVILYLDDCKGGELDLTDEAGQSCHNIEARKNRLVAFTTPDQWHRVNECYSTRRSICLFFWSECDADLKGETQAKFV